MMKKLARSHAGFTLVMMILLAAPFAAQAQKTHPECDDYADTGVQQARDYRTFGCAGRSIPGNNAGWWTENREVHRQWCNDVKNGKPRGGPRPVEKGTQLRADVLRACRPLDLTCADGSQPIATLTSTYQRVEVGSKDDSRGWRPAPRGTRLCRGDFIRTGPRGRARVLIDDRLEDLDSGPSVINIGARTEIQLESFLLEPRASNSILGLIKGRVRIFMNRLTDKSSYAVRTGSSICGIRGSHVGSEHDPGTGRTAHMVDHGLLVCEAPAGPIPVRDGEMIEIVRGRFGRVHPLDRARFARLEADTGAMDGGVAGETCEWREGGILFPSACVCTSNGVTSTAANARCGH